MCGKGNVKWRCSGCFVLTCRMGCLIDHLELVEQCRWTITWSSQNRKHDRDIFSAAPHSPLAKPKYSIASNRELQQPSETKNKGDREGPAAIMDSTEKLRPTKLRKKYNEDNIYLTSSIESSEDEEIK